MDLDFKNYHFTVMNAENLQFSENSFDLVYGTGILHHLDLDRAYSELSRIMRSGGHAVFFEPLGHNPLLNAFRKSTPHLRTADEHPFLVSDFVKARQYFSEVHVEYYGLTTLCAIPFRKLSVGPAIMKICETMDKVLNVIPFVGRYAWHAVLVFTK